MSETLRASILGFARAQHVLTLATTGPDGPWAAALFYAADDDLQLYFISSPETRHARDLEQHSAQVAAAISNAATDWSGIRGLQIDGVAARVPPEERPRVERLYLDRFPEVEALLADPHSPDFRRIAERFASSRFYRITPRRIRLVDNARGFGYREEYVVPPG